MRLCKAESGDSMETKLKKAVKGKADHAYSRYIELLKRTECLGSEAKIKTGVFNTKMLAAHVNAGVELGRHRAFMEVYNGI